MNKKGISALIEEFNELEQSPKNEQRKRKWGSLHSTARDQWRPTPRMDGSWQEQLPISVELQNNFWSKYFNFNITEYHTKPEIFLENNLKIALERFKIFEDDYFLSKNISIWGTCAYEASFFGIPVHYYDQEDPWPDHGIIINEIEDLKKLEIPNFYKSGMMPQTINFYEQVSELVGSDFEVLFPEWVRGPFGVATYLRGFENLLVDMLTEPEFTFELMEFVTNSRESWFYEFSKYLKKPIPKGNLLNDEVNCPTLSPNLYEEFVLPFEQRLEKFHQGILYWHSCGDVTPLLPRIAKIDNLEMMHLGPWTAVDVAAETFQVKAPLEICMNAVSDVFESTPETLSQKVSKVLSSCKENDLKGLTMRLSPINFTDSIEHTVKHVEKWISTVRNSAKGLR